MSSPMVDWGKIFDQWNQCQLNRQPPSGELQQQMSRFLPWNPWPLSQCGMLYNALDWCNKKLMDPLSSTDALRWSHAKQNVMHKIFHAINFPSRPIPLATFHKKKLFIMPHAGLGDNINMIGAIRFLNILYDEVVIGSGEHNKKNIEGFYADDQSFKVFGFAYSNYLDPVPKLLESFEAKEYEVIVPSVGCWGGRAIGGSPTESGDIFYRIFYEQCGLSYDIHRWHFTYIHRNKLQEQALFQSLGLTTKSPYVFVHATPEILSLIRQKVPPNATIVSAVEGKPLMDHITIIERAAGIYVMDSSFFCLCSILNLSHISDKNMFIRHCSTNGKYTNSYYRYLHPLDTQWKEYDLMAPEPPRNPPRPHNVLRRTTTNKSIHTPVAFLSSAAVPLANANLSSQSPKRLMRSLSRRNRFSTRLFSSRPRVAIKRIMRSSAAFVRLRKPVAPFVIRRIPFRRKNKK